MLLGKGYLEDILKDIMYPYLKNGKFLVASLHQNYINM